MTSLIYARLFLGDIMNKWYFENLYKEETPLMFSDGTEVYNKLKEEYKTHEILFMGLVCWKNLLYQSTESEKLD